jgi:hypothetical protein
VPETQITLRILRRGLGTEELLANVERRFGAGHLHRDDFGAVRIRVSGRAAVAWDQVRDASTAPEAIGGSGFTSRRGHSAAALELDS